MVPDSFSYILNHRFIWHLCSWLVMFYSDGAAGCGVFIAAYNATELLAVDGAVNLFSVVHDIHIRRPEMITTMVTMVTCVIEAVVLK